ncbi:MAG: aryl-sulfate sulfotransferase [Rikenellaceae bacterium]
MKSKLYLVILTMLSLFFACSKDIEQNSNNKNEDTSKETITELNFTNTFASGDIIALSDTSNISSVTLNLSTVYSSEDEIIGTVREFSLNLSSPLTSLTASATILAPSTDQTWALCRKTDQVWSEVSDVNYIYQDSTASASFILDLTSAQVGQDYLVLELAFVEIDKIFGSLESTLNPSTHNALAALVTFTSQVELTPTMTLLGQDNNDIIRTLDKGTSHNIDILGLYNNYKNTIYIDCQITDDITIRKTFNYTPTYPDIDNYVITTYRSENLITSPDAIYFNGGNKGGDFNSTVTDDYGYRVVSVGIDQFGKIRWIFSENLSTYGTNMRVFPVNYKGQKSLAIHSASKTGIYIHDYSGNRLFESEDNLYLPHHDAAMADDNTIAVLDSSDSKNQCTIREIDLTTGELKNTINIDEIRDPDRVLLSLAQSLGNDPVHVNSVVYSAEDDCYIASTRFQGVFKIKRGATSASDIVWWLTPDYGFSNESVWRDYLLTPVDSSGEPLVDSLDWWNAGQHAATILPNGDIMMFDNHNESGTGDAYDENYTGDHSYTLKSRVWVVRIDEDNKTVQSICSWYSPNDDFSTYMSNAVYHSNAKTIVSGWATTDYVYETEYSIESGTTGELLFSAYFDEANYTKDHTYRFYKTNFYQED